MPSDRPSLTDEGLKDFRSVVAEAENLGGATAKATREAREFYDHVPPEERYHSPAFTPLGESAVPHPPDETPPGSSARDLPHEDFDHGGSVADGKMGGPARDHTAPGGDQPHEQWPPPASPHDELDLEAESPPRSYRGLVRIVLILIILGAIAAGGYWQRGRIMSLASSLMRPSPAVQQQQPQREATAQGRPKISDRIGADNQPSDRQPAASPAAAVAQKVVLYEEDPNDAKGKRYVGSAIWKTETVSPGPGLAPELVIRADVDIPERRIRMAWSLRRNTDKALPASHTIEIMFTLPADFSEGAINNVPGVLMKQNEETRGVPLSGLAVKVTNGFFLIGLSAAEVDVQRNVQLLKERMWFDVPVVYTSGKRAILAVEKGTPGERAFEEAFRAWGQ